MDKDAARARDRRLTPGSPALSMREGVNTPALFFSRSISHTLFSRLFYSNCVAVSCVRTHLLGFHWLTTTSSSQRRGYISPPVELGRYRVNWMVLRELMFAEFWQILVSGTSGCLTVHPAAQGGEAGEHGESACQQWQRSVVRLHTVWNHHHRWRNPQLQEQHQR